VGRVSEAQPSQGATAMTDLPIKPQAGVVLVGTRVELLDSQGCGRTMASVPVAIGKLKGNVGCVSTSALSSQKP